MLFCKFYMPNVLKIHDFNFTIHNIKILNLKKQPNFIKENTHTGSFLHSRLNYQSSFIQKTTHKYSFYDSILQIYFHTTQSSFSLLQPRNHVLTSKHKTPKVTFLTLTESFTHDLLL
jgi:hypothetical protein